MSLLWAQKLQSFYHKIANSFLYSDLDPSPSLSFKINVDVIVRPYFSSIAAVARDRRGGVGIFADAMKVNTALPLQRKQRPLSGPSL